MKIGKTIRMILVAVTVAAVIFSFTSCASKINFLNSSVVPAARGRVKISRDHNRNYVLDINIYNLAEVKRLTPPRETYVVWLQAGSDAAKNIGQIKSTTNMFSKNLSASVNTVSSSKPTKVFVTAEDDGAAQYPGMQVVLSTDNF